MQTILSLLLAPLLALTPQFFPSRGAEGVNPDTHLVLTFSGTPSVGDAGFIRVYDAVSGALVDELDLSIPAGPAGPRTYGPECDYTHVPYDYTRDHMPTNRDTKAGTPSGGAWPEPDPMQVNIIGGFTDGFHFRPVIVRGHDATIYLHNNMLEYGHSYRVTVDPGVIRCGDFEGISGDGWTFTTRPDGPADPRYLVVDASGHGDFNTLQGALDYVPDFSEQTVEIRVRAGRYEEIVYCRNKSHLVVRGEGMFSTLVCYENNEVFNPHPLNIKTNEKRGTYPSRRAAVFFDHCEDIVLQDITFQTLARGQAEGLLLCGERIALYRVRILGDGDALQSNGTVYMQDSILEGGGDTILGRGSLFAYRSIIRNYGGPASWVRNFAPDHGDIFVECYLEGQPGRPLDFGRSRGYADAELVLIDCRTRHVAPIGWSVLEDTATALEFNTRDADTGEPVDFSQRHPVSRRLDAVRDAALIRSYRDPAFILAGWSPSRQPLP